MSLAGFLFCPIFGHIGGRIDPKLIVVIGGIAQGISCILFGYLIHLEDVASFVVLSYILRLYFNRQTTPDYLLYIKC